MKRLSLAFAALTAAVCAAGAAAQSPVVPIPSLALVPPAPAHFIGHAATAQPIRHTGRIPQDRYMAPNGTSEIHDDGWQTNVYRWDGPLGRSPQTLSSYLPPGHDCGSITMDSRGRIVSICVGASGPELYMFDPNTLATLATFSLPPRSAEELKLYPNIFQDYSNGGYFYLDNHDQVVVGTTTQQIYVIGEDGATPGFKLVHDYDLSKVLRPNELITSALPDSHGLLWFVARQDGVVGTLNLETGRIRVRRLGHGTVGEIENSFAVGQRGAVYIATNRKLYRFRAQKGGRPKIVWQIAYPNSYETKPGQVDDGTGSTPAVMAHGYVSISDNADPMDVVVYRTAKKLHRHQRRLVCKVPVFSRGASSNENGLIAVGRSMIIEDNYGYTTPANTEGGKQTVPGFARVDLNRGGRGCHLVWTNTSEDAPTVVSKLSLANGLIYTYTKGPGPDDPWYWTALDYRTGKTVFKVLSGTGIGYNNNYSGIVLGRNGTAYLGAIGGIMALRDG